MNGPLLVIRADASLNGGTGHIMRTLAIAQEWISRGGRCSYLCATLPAKMQTRLEDEGCNVLLLSTSPGSDEEASESSTHLQQLRPHWLLIDSYPLTQSYQSKLVLHPRTKTANISDFGCSDFYRPDLVIHPNIEVTGDYSSCQATLLAGPEYTLLRTEIIHQQINNVTSNAANLLITMGGSDPLEASAKICHHLIKTGQLNTLSVKVILGPAYPKDGQMHQLNHPRLKIITSPPSMKNLYIWADTAISSPSTTALELAYYGLPIGLIITADNQEKVLAAMLQNNCALSIADARQQSIYFEQINSLLNSAERVEIAHNAKLKIDGKGTQRICEAMHLPQLYFRSATINDAKTLWQWTNDPATRAASFSSEPIPWENHLAWLSNQLNSPDVVFLIVESAHQKFGVVRYNLNAEATNESIISIGLAPEARGKGLAPLIISRSATHFFALNPQQTITAWIKPDNKASIQSFSKANFENYPSPLQPDQVRMRLVNKSS